MGSFAEAVAERRMRAAAADLFAALSSLRNELAGIVGTDERGLRSLFGNTNVEVLLLRMREADALMAKIREGM